MKRILLVSAALACVIAPATAAPFRSVARVSEAAASPEVERRAENVLLILAHKIAARVKGESKTTVRDDAKSKRVPEARECELEADAAAQKSPAGRKASRQGPEPIYLAF